MHLRTSCLQPPPFFPWRRRTISDRRSGPVPGSPLAFGRPVPRRARAGRRGRSGRCQALLLRRGQRRRLADRRRRPHVAADLRRANVGSIGAIAVAPSNRNILYVGTGEADMRSDIAQGIGMFRSSDGGATLAARSAFQTRSRSPILVDPRNPNVLLVAALGHPYGPNPNAACSARPTAAGTGPRRSTRTRTPARSTWPSSPAIRRRLCRAVADAPAALEHLSAVERARQRLYKSTDGGRTWRQLAGHGLPGSSGADRPHRSAARTAPRLCADRQRQAGRGRPLSLGQLGRELDQGHRRQAHLESRLVLRRDHRRTRRTPTSCGWPTRSCCAPTTAAPISSRSKAIRPATTSTLCGSTRRTPTGKSSASTRERSSPSTAAGRGAAGTTSRPAQFYHVID